MEDSSEKRTIDTKAIAEKEGAKADTEANLEKMTVEKKDKIAEAYATATTLKDLHLECDWLLSNFDARKEARAGEAGTVTHYDHDFNMARNTNTAVMTLNHSTPRSTSRHHLASRVMSRWTPSRRPRPCSPARTSPSEPAKGVHEAIPSRGL